MTDHMLCIHVDNVYSSSYCNLQDTIESSKFHSGPSKGVFLALQKPL